MFAETTSRGVLANAISNALKTVKICQKKREREKEVLRGGLMAIQQAVHVPVTRLQLAADSKCKLGKER